MTRLWNYLLGYVMILVKGEMLHKFINICQKRRIRLWRIKKKPSGELNVCMKASDFKRIRPAVRKSNTKVHIVHKIGLPFLMRRVLGKKMFVIGFILFAGTLLILPSFVWKIEVKGNQKLTSTMIADSINKMGVRPGVFKYSIEPKKIVQNLMEQYKELSWTEVVISGTKLIVNVAERRSPPELVDKSAIGDIVAKMDAVIQNVYAKAGDPQVKAGDTVKCGQMLISGTMKNKLDEVSGITHAMGSVIARTWHQAKMPVKEKQEEKIFTGQHIENYYMLFGTDRTLVPFLGGSFKYYEKESSQIMMSFGEDIVLPFGIEKEVLKEYTLDIKEVSFEDAEANAIHSAEQEVINRLPSSTQVVKKMVLRRQDESGQKYINLILECIEEIGLFKKNGVE